MTNRQGFSIVELSITLAIMGIVAAVAVPSLLTAQRAANEAAAIQGCRAIAIAEMAYSATNNQQYTDIPGLIKGNFLDARFSRKVNGYSFAPGDVAGCTLDGAPPSSFGFIATPETGHGRYSYGIGPDQIVRYQGSTLPPGVGEGDPLGKESRGVSWLNPFGNF